MAETLNTSHRISADCILMDVEGTTSSISFVHDVMFPFARNHIAQFLKDSWGDPKLDACLEQLAADAGLESFPCDGSPEETQRSVVGAVYDLMDRDAKVTGLKCLQGMIWKAGFESGELVSHVYPEVAGCLRDWHAGGLDLRIYSSGSIQAQKLFFAHTTAGDLLPLISGHYDTTSGGKKEAGSYSTIAAHVGAMPQRIIFVSDVAAELDAALEAGMQTVLSVRPGNAETDVTSHRAINGFDELNVSKS